MHRKPPARTWTLLLAGLALTALAAPRPARADDEAPSIRKRGDDEKQFASAVGTAVIKAAHGTAQKIALVEHKMANPKAGRTDLILKMEYHGIISGKRYLADVVVKIDSSNKEAWEVLNIDYSDNNGIARNDKKIQDLIKHFNK
jgi:hypothetical protein